MVADHDYRLTPRLGAGGCSTGEGRRKSVCLEWPGRINKSGEACDRRSGFRGGGLCACPHGPADPVLMAARATKCDEKYPYAGLLLAADGYGTTYAGGDAKCGGCGTIFTRREKSCESNSPVSIVYRFHACRRMYPPFTARSTDTMKRRGSARAHSRDVGGARGCEADTGRRCISQDGRVSGVRLPAIPTRAANQQRGAPSRTRHVLSRTTRCVSILRSDLPLDGSPPSGSSA